MVVCASPVRVNVCLAHLILQPTLYHALHAITTLIVTSAEAKVVNAYQASLSQRCQIISVCHSLARSTPVKEYAQSALNPKFSEVMGWPALAHSPSTIPLVVGVIYAALLLMAASTV